MATVNNPRVPQPYTSTGAPGVGGRFRTACNETENGSASTASSSRTSSGIAIHIDSCAGTNGANPPVATLLFPVWIPGGMWPRAKLRQIEYCPSRHSRQGGSMPRGPHDSHGFKTTQSPTRRVRTAGPTRSTVPTTSCPSTCGNEMMAVIGLSMLPFRNTCLESLPQMPQRRVRSTSQSWAGNEGSGISRRFAGENGPRKKRLSSRPRRLDTTCLGKLASHTRARMSGRQSSPPCGTQAAPGLRGPGELGHHAAVAAPSRPHRDIPSVERLLRSPGAAPLLARWKRERVVDAVRLVLDDVRRGLDEGGAVPADADLVARTGAYLDAAAAPPLQRVVNATGVVLHTNLGRAPLAEASVEAITLAARGAVNLELDVVSGRRGSRDALVEDDLRALTGAEAALVVNNNAAAVLLAIAALAAGREVVVSRGELVEIGGGFRMP